MKPLHDLPETLRLRGERGDIVLKLGVALPQVGVLPRQGLGRWGTRHGLGIQTGAESDRANGALSRPSADAATSVGIACLEIALHRKGSTAWMAAHARRRD